MIDTTTPTQPQTEPPTLTVYAGYPVYPMPVFASVAATDVERTVIWFRDFLGFGVMFVAPGPDGAPVMAHVRRARYQDVLVTRSLAEPDPGTAVTLTFQAGEAEDVGRIAEQARAADPAAVEGPLDTPWNTRDVVVTDPDGNRFAFTGRGVGRPEDFSTWMGDVGGDRG